DDEDPYDDCGTDETCCSGSCTDITTESNCGSCGDSCDDDQKCKDSECKDAECGNGDCEAWGGETYLTCEEDCCQDDCTGAGDSTCHESCAGYNGCENKTWYEDADDDGCYVDTQSAACDPGSDWRSSGSHDGDCDDSDDDRCYDFDEVCDDGIDNDCDGDIDHEDSDCPVEITGISVSDTCPEEDTNIDVECTSDPGEVDCVKASLDGTDCSWQDWTDSDTALFECSVGSYTTETCDSGDSYTAKCYIDPSCSQEGSNKTDEVYSLPSGCSAYSSESTCNNENDCEWCPECDGNKYNGLGGDQCVASGSCTYNCDVSADCGAECDNDVGGCEDDCDGDTRYYDSSCQSDCTCSDYTTYDCTDDNTDCSYDSCDDDNTRTGTKDTYTCDSGDCVYDSTVSCSSDCSGDQCCDGGSCVSEGTCSGAEICSDSQWISHCGDGVCNCGEDVDSCPEDCGECGDGICDSTEDWFSCPGDCNCSLDSASITPNCGGEPCNVGDTVNITGDLSGTACPSIGHFQIDAENGTCNIAYEGDIEGIYNNTAPLDQDDSNSVQGTWEIKSISSECAGKIFEPEEAVIYPDNSPSDGWIDDTSSLSGSLELADAETWYHDADGDQYHNDTTVSTTDPGSDWTDTQYHEELDCDDSDDTIHPGADEVCDGVDNDCDGAVDEDSPCEDESLRCIDGECVAVNVSAIEAEDCIYENEAGSVNCTANGQANCVEASIDGSSSNCDFQGWSGNKAMFGCSHPTNTTTDCGSPGSVEAKCYVDQDKCSQTGDNETTDIRITDSECLGYEDEATCEDTSGCEWCENCSQNNPDVTSLYQANNYGGSSTCVPTGTCSYSCQSDVCGAECSSGSYTDCTDLSGYGGGEAACNSTCQYDTSSCCQHECDAIGVSGCDYDESEDVSFYTECVEGASGCRVWDDSVNNDCDGEGEVCDPDEGCRDFEERDIEVISDDMMAKPNQWTCGPITIENTKYVSAKVNVSLSSQSKDKLTQEDWSYYFGEEGAWISGEDQYDYVELNVPQKNVNEGINSTNLCVDVPQVAPGSRHVEAVVEITEPV
ncbi:MAG: hypothetical protein ACLFS3_01550, partial [Candidatus Aenigmatarchaeota archaeon]